MFEIKDQEKIGDFLNDMIKKKYGTTTDFCREYLKVSDSENDENALTNLKNRISSIVHGKKDIQQLSFAFNNTSIYVPIAKESSCISLINGLEFDDDK